MYFVGWVPTVTGHLSFGSIGHSTHPTRSKRLRHGNTICVLQHRDLLDVVLPFSENSAVGRFVRETFANRVVGISGQFTFTTICVEDATGEHLNGHVYLLPKKDNSDALNALKKEFGCDVSVKEHFDRTKDSIDCLCRNGSKSSASFQLSRNGRFVLQFEPNYVDDPVLERLIANQFFYFFKDISHVHQHHDPKQDAITQLTKVSDIGDTLWIKKTQHSLYREVIRYKRFRSEGALFRASGILAYAQSFERSHIDSKDTGHTFNNDELERSLAVSRDELKHSDQKRLASIEAGRNWFFSLFGLIISATFLARLDNSDFKIDVNKFLLQFTEFVAQKPQYVILSVIMIAVISSFFTHQRDPANNKIVRTALSWMQGFHIRWHFFSNVILTTFFTFLFYWFFVRQIF